MNRRRNTFIVVVLVLFAILISTWVVQFDAKPPFGLWGRPSDDQTTAGDHLAGATDDPFLDSCTGEDDDEGERNGPLEVDPDDEHLAAPPPEPMDVPDRGAGETDDTEKESVEATMNPGKPEVVNSDADFDLNPFIVSTLKLHPVRRTALMASKLGNTALVKWNAQAEDAVDGYFNDFQTEFGYVLQGKVQFPELEQEDKERLTRDMRMQAWLYTQEFPDFHCAVNANTTSFALQLSSEQAKTYRQKGLRIYLHSPAFRIKGGKEYVELKKAGTKLPVIELELAPVFKLTVRVTPEGAVENGVRAWMERRGVACPLDDSIFMSADVPPSGELVFHVPEHYGEIRVGVTGSDWHSGLPRFVKLSDWKKTRTTVNIECTPEPCDKYNGVVGWHQTHSTEGVKDVPSTFREGGIARIEDTAFGTVLYSAKDGSFDGMFPYTTRASNRQLIVSMDRFITRAVPLDGTFGDEGSAWIEGGGRPPFGDWKISLEYRLVVDLRLPELKDDRNSVILDGVMVVEPGMPSEQLKLLWKQRLLTVYDATNLKAVKHYWISDEAWETALKLRNSGREQVTLKLIELEDYVRKKTR